MLYRHIRPDKDEVFYVGIGKPKRAYSKHNRNKYWKNIVNKNPNYVIEILFEALSWEQACDKEKEFIKLYGRKDLGTGSLCNLTDGGEGNVNPCKETRERISKALSGEKNPHFGKTRTEEWKNYMAKRMSGKNNHNYGKPLPEWQKEINRNAQLGRKQSKETIEKRRLKVLGKKKLMSEDWKLKNVLIMGKKVVNTNTNMVFNSIKLAAESINIKPSTLAAKLRGELKNNTPFKKI